MTIFVPFLRRTETLRVSTLLCVLVLVWYDIAPSQTENAQPDSAAVSDSIRVRFIPRFGKLQTAIDSGSSLHNSSFIWTDARYFGDLVFQKPGWFLRHQSEPGQPPQLNTQGIDWRGIPILLDGRPLSDPMTGTLNLYDLPIEYIDHVELFSGANSTAIAPIAAGTALNIVSRSYNTVRPITKIRFLQGPFEHLLTDALFSQNVATATNLTVGVQRQVTEGRYVNAAYDSWSVRTRLRYNVSDRINIAVSDLYTKANAGLNGGVFFDSTRTVFEEGLATVRFPTAHEQRSRHDLTFAFLAKPFDDSLSLSQVSVYYSTSEREFVDGSNPQNEAIGSYSWDLFGVRAVQRVHSSFHSTLIGAQAERRQVNPETRFPFQHKEHYTFFASTEIMPLDAMSASVSLRQESLRGTDLFSYGASFGINALPGIRLTGGYSSTGRYLSIREFNWGSFSGAHPLRSVERHRLAEAGIDISANGVSLSVGLFRRSIENAVVYRVTPTQDRLRESYLESVPLVRVQGGSAFLGWKLWRFEATGSLTYTEPYQTRAEDVVVPKLFLRGEIAFRDKFFRDHLDAKIGVRVRYDGKQRGQQFDPARYSFIDNNAPELPDFSTFDLYGVFKIGDAYVNITWENAADIRYMVTAFYPALGSNFKLGINWVFLD